jgi:hypothetical protein
VFGHVPFRNVLLSAFLTFERPTSFVLSEVHFEVGPSVILFITAFMGAVEFVNVLMCFFVVSQYPRLAER